MPAGRETWLTPIAEVHERRFGPGSFFHLFGKAGKALKPLHDAGVPSEKIAAHYEVFLEEGYDRRFGVNFFRFVETFNDWAPVQLQVDDTGVIG